MTPLDLRAWQARMGYTYDTAAKALDISRSKYGYLLRGDWPIGAAIAALCREVEATQNNPPPS